MIRLKLLIVLVMTQVTQIRWRSNQMLIQWVLILQGLCSLEAPKNPVVWRQFHFKPIQKNSSQQEATSVFSLETPFKDSPHDKRKDKQGKCMPPQQFGCLSDFDQRGFWNHCIAHLLEPLLCGCLIITLPRFFIKTNRSVLRKIEKGANCYEL